MLWLLSIVVNAPYQFATVVQMSVLLFSADLQASTVMSLQTCAPLVLMIGYLPDVHDKVLKLL